MIAGMSDYPPATRARLLDAAAEVLLATVAADRTGVIAYYREVLAAGRYLYDAQRKYAHNALIAALFEHTWSDEERDSDDEPLTRERLLGRLAEVGEALNDDEEAAEFKTFLFELAERVAKASGGLWGGISADEAAFLSELRRLLKMQD
jgi:hypothetical protein